MEKSRKTKLKMEYPANYRILVQGDLDQRWTGRMGGLEITVFNSEKNFMVTQLSGEMLDQAALMGVLNTLYELRLPLLMVVGMDYFDDFTFFSEG